MGKYGISTYGKAVYGEYQHLCRRWKPEDIFNFSDMDKIERNMEILLTVTADNFEVTGIVLNTARTYADIITEAELNRIEGNIQSIQEQTTLYGIKLEPRRVWAGYDRISNEDINRIADNIDKLFDAMRKGSSFAGYCGMAVCGNEEMI